MNEQYNGWTNRETWACHLWITNDPVLHAHFTEPKHEDRKLTLTEATESLRGYFEDCQTIVKENQAVREMATMLFAIGSLWRVDWHAIASALIESEGTTHEDEDAEFNQT